ncbi:restriction endonuclease [Microcoleus anatoxicus]|uniref:Restriction endonuclease n=1 Tax=Microcoleus anatoxicus PTRS2 TaxID=2705321 RepID=A0ABU8YHY0_9CYAN|nr:MAG: restriction endonuclease [Oscillatoriales cyanobacterium]
MLDFILVAGLVITAVSMILEWIDTFQEEESRKRLSDSGIWEVDLMTGKEFENFLAIHFRNFGYSVTLTQHSQDYGADLILYKDGSKTVAQAKRSKNPVGIKAVQEVAGAVRHYKANKARVITNNRFTKNAYNLAKSNNVELWDRKKLIEFILIAKNSGVMHSD